MIKNRKSKQNIYEEKYNGIPLDLKSRLNYMCDLYNVSETKYNDILYKKQCMLDELYYLDLNIILYEEPEGSPRPRSRIVTRTNYMNEAIVNSNFVHVYSITGKEDSLHMKRLIDNELVELRSMVYTPCSVVFNAYFKTPSYYNTVDKFIAEIGLDRTICKPDWDNIGKKYSDMYNHNIWLDDSIVISGTVNKYYSILPRVEINLRYLNALYNVHQYRSTTKKLGENRDDIYYLNNKGNLTKG